MSTDGLFVDRRTCWEGRIGQLRVQFATVEGGAVVIGLAGADGELSQRLLTLGARLRLVCRCDSGAADFDQPVLIRQEHDPRPKLSFLEEGPVRIGMRVTFDLLDELGHYHGGGRQDVWVYPEGDIHVTMALETEDLRGHGRIDDCYLEFTSANEYATALVGERTILLDGAEAVLPLITALTEKAVVLAPTDGLPAVAFYWSRNQGVAYPMSDTDHGTLPPYYATRWRTGMEQWLLFTKYQGWTLAPSASVTIAGSRLCWHWLRDAGAEGNVIHGATLVISLAASVDELRQRIQSVQAPLTPQIVGGEFRCYTEEDGLYEFGQGDPTRAVITFPPDPLERVVRLRYYRRKTDPRHHGAVIVEVDGTPVRAQLMSEGELTDDICVPMEMAHRRDSVDDVIVAAPLHRERPTEIRIEKVPGIQAVYESEITGLDLQRRAGNHRDVVIWNSRNPLRPAMEFDLFSSALHRITAFQQCDPAVWEAPMAAFHDSGHARYDYCDAVEAFSIEKNGPDEVRLYAKSYNPNRCAQSELWLSVPYHHPRLRFEATVRMTVLKQWDCSTCELSDIFPFPSRLIETWYYQGILFLEHDRSFMYNIFRPDRSYRGPGESRDGRLFYGMFASDRGNVLTLFRNHSHPAQPLVYGVCGHYVDIHIHFRPTVVPVPAGEVFEISYVFELYGDQHTSVDEIRRIGELSLAAGDIVIP